MKAITHWKYPEAIVECGWLKKRINQKNIRIFDCTTYLHYTDDNPDKPYDVESGLKSYQFEHIPSSAFIDLQLDLSDRNSSYNFTLPNLEILSKRFQKLGIGEQYHVVLYSRNGMQWSSRIWWMLRSVGFDQVSILNGGFIEWIRLGLPTDNRDRVFDTAKFIFKPRLDIFVKKDAVLGAIYNKSVLLLNSLTEDIHLGDNPRYGRRGRIPNSINIPFNQLLNQKNGKLISIERIIKIFKKKGVTPDLLILNYCGGGIAASLEAFVLFQLGFENIQIYDNSMSEWAMDKKLPIEVGKS